MVEAGLHYEYFCVVSSQDTTKFNDDECLKKWKNIVLSCGEKQKDISRIMYFMKHIAINVLHESIYDLFDKKTMLVCMGEKMVVKKEYQQYTIDTLNRFCGVVTTTKIEVFQVQYDEKYRVIKVIERYGVNEFNLFLGLKMKIETHDEWTYDSDRTLPFQNHAMTECFMLQIFYELFCS